MLNGLINHLKAETSIPWAYMAWSKSPDDLYGVVTLFDQSELGTDYDSVSEKMFEGYVDVFTRNDDGSEITRVENCLRDLGIWWTMESTQFEDDTGYIHYEWRWRDTNGKASEDVVLITFVTLRGTTYQCIPRFTTPTAPTVGNTLKNGILYTFYRWDSPIVAVRADKVYTALYSTDVWIQDGKAWQSENDPFTTSQISDLISIFAAGSRIVCVFNGGLTRTSANSIDEYGIGWNDSDPASPAPWAT